MHHRLVQLLMDLAILFVSILPVSCYFTFMIRTDIQFNYYRKNLVPNSSQRNKSLKVTKFLGNTTCNNLNTLEIRIKSIFLYIKFTIYPIQPLQGNKSFSDKNTQMVNFFRSRIWFIGFISHCDLNYFYGSEKIHFPIYVFFFNYMAVLFTLFLRTEVILLSFWSIFGFKSL